MSKPPFLFLLVSGGFSPLSFLSASGPDTERGTQREGLITLSFSSCDAERDLLSKKSLDCQYFIWNHRIKRKPNAEKGENFKREIPLTSKNFLQKLLLYGVYLTWWWQRLQISLFEKLPQDPRNTTGQNQIILFTLCYQLPLLELWHKTE